MRWTPEEIETLKTLYPTGVKPCMEALGKSRTSIKSKACRLKIVFNPEFTEEENNYLKLHGDKKSVTKISRELKRSWNATSRALKKLGIEFTNTSGKWIPNDEEVAILRSNLTFTSIALMVKRSIPTVIRRMREMSLIDPGEKRRFNPNYKPRTPSIKSIPLPTVQRSIGNEDRIKEALMRLGL